MRISSKLESLPREPGFLTGQRRSETIVTTYPDVLSRRKRAATTFGKGGQRNNLHSRDSGRKDQPGYGSFV